MYHIKRKTAILIVSFLCTGSLILLGALIQSRQQAAYYIRNIEAGYSRAFAQLTSDITELDMSLQKAVYSTSPALLNALCTNIYGKANAAQTSMSELPFSDYTLENAAAFITRTGDYAFAISRKISGGSALTDDEYSTLKVLSDTASILSQNLLDMQSELESGAICISQIGQADIGTGSAAELLGDRFQMVENEFPEIPVLIYDGPFSQHINTSAPAMLSGQNDITESEALQKAAAFMAIPQSKLLTAYESGGEIPCYNFSTADGRQSISITKQGGMVLSMSKYTETGDAVLDISAAIDIAKDFLADHGFQELKERYWTRYDNILLVNFAAVSGDYMCYPDLIKAEISLDNGDITGFESAGYILNHTDRKFPSDIISSDTAQNAVSQDLAIVFRQLCIIPSDGQKELFCYEFTCENERGNHYMVYINAETGEQEKILCLIEDANGTLTM